MNKEEGDSKIVSVNLKEGEIEEAAAQVIKFILFLNLAILQDVL